MRKEVKAALRKIDRKGHALLTGGHAWDESLFTFALQVENLTYAERQLISWWIAAWRRRVSSAKRSNR